MCKINVFYNLVDGAVYHFYTQIDFDTKMYHIL